MVPFRGPEGLVKWRKLGGKYLVTLSLLGTQFFPEYLIRAPLIM